MSNIQIHGFATQSLLYSGSNNYLGMNTSQGSTGWTEAAINIVDQPSDKSEYKFITQDWVFSATKPQTLIGPWVTTASIAGSAFARAK